MKILLIAGHGAGDTGAVGGGFHEADLTRETVTKISAELKKSADVTVFDFSKNMYQYLKGGGKFDFSGYDYVLEVHFNAGAKKEQDGKTTGVEILVHTDESGVSVEEKILEKISALGLKSRGIKRRKDLRNMNVIHKKGISYALLEVCFIDDPDDMAVFSAKSGLIAKAAADGIKEGFGMSEKELESVNDIVWELEHRGILTNKELWLKKLSEDENSYWLARKCVNYIINN